MRNQIPRPMSSLDRNLSKNTMRYVENTNKKSSFFLLINMSIQPLWLTYFIEILLVLEFQLTKTYHHHVFSGISCFWGREVHQKYAVRVRVRCGIKFRIQQALLIKI